MTTMVIWVENLEPAAEFYSELLSATRKSESAEFVEVSSDIHSVLLHKVPDQYRIGISTPPAVREDSAIKPVFEVTSIDYARRNVSHTAGHIKPAQAEQRYGAVIYCDGFDCEGNVIQLSQRL